MVLPSGEVSWTVVGEDLLPVAGIRVDPLHRVSMTVVSSTTAWHQSSRVAASVRSPFIASHRLDAASPLPDIVARLNELQPGVLVAYASMIRALAEHVRELIFKPLGR